MPEIPAAGELFGFLSLNARAIAPQLHLIVWGLGLLCLDFILPGRGIRFLGFYGKSFSVALALLGLIAASIQLWLLWGTGNGDAFYNMVTQDAFSEVFGILFLVSAILAIALSYRHLDIEDAQHSEYYSILLFATAGMMFMAGAIDLVTIFVGLELMSVSTYILVGFLRRQRRSNEASMKYFLMGAFSTAIILYGMSLLYGISGSTNLNVIAQEAARREDNTLLILALFLMLAGLCFKVAAVPFHMWAPDAYEGAPTGITAFMSVAVKAAAFAVFLRIFYVTFHDFHDLYMGVLAIIAMATMTWGNVAAVTQQNVKRLLAYSSISHAGFVLMGLVVGTQPGISASVVYLFAYTFMNLGAWAIVILLRRRDVIGESIEDFNGLYFKHPGLAILNLIFFLSLAGIPPLAGFIAKYAVFAAVIESALATGQAHGQLLMWLAVVAALNAVVSLFYYLRIVVAMFIERESLPVPLSFSVGVWFVLLVTGFFTIFIGIYPDPFFDLARIASLPLVF